MKKMLKNKLILCILVVAILVGFAWSASWAQQTQGKISAPQCLIVNIVGMQRNQSIRIEGNNTLSISKGDCVVWFNRAEGPNLQIVFEDGKACADATKAPSETTHDFKMGYGTCFVSSLIPFAGISSLRFLEKGSYKYTIESVTGDHPKFRGTKVATGTILVE